MYSNTNTNWCVFIIAVYRNMIKPGIPHNSARAICDDSILDVVKMVFP